MLTRTYLHKKLTDVPPSPLPKGRGPGRGVILCSTAVCATYEAMNPQGEFNFDPDASGEGYTRWLLGRRMAVEILARKMNLSLGREVEVWLFGGIRLRGLLRLKEEALFIEEDRVRHLELTVDHVPFTYREMESCVRLD